MSSHTKVTRHALVATVLCAFAGSAFGQVILFEDDFEGGTSASNYTIVADPSDPVGNGGQDLADFAFAFTDLGTVGDVRSGTAAQFITQDAFTAFVSGLTIDGSKPISIKYDLYADWESRGSTEYSFVGVGNGSLPFQHYLRSTAIGTEETQGVFAGGLTDSDTAADGDYVVLESDGSVGSPTDLFNGDAALAAQTGADFSDILPEEVPGPSGEVARAARLEHRWVPVELLIDAIGDVTYRLNGKNIATVTPSISPTGLVGFGIGDPFTSTNQGISIPPSANTNILIDNVVITQLPEPASLGLLGFVLALFAGARRRS